MKKKGLLIVTFNICMTIALALLAFVPAYGQPAVPKTIKIGALYDITGPLANRGDEAGWGFRKAVEVINKDGGVYVKEFNKKIPLQLLEADLQTSEERGVIQAQYLSDQGVVLLIATTAFLPQGPELPRRIDFLLWRQYHLWRTLFTMGTDICSATIR